METNALKKFAQDARKQLRKEVSARLAQVERQDNAVLREKADIKSALDKRIEATSRDRIIEEVAYTWFNRLCALRYMDLNDFNRLKVVSPVNGATQPEILQEAKNGYIDNAFTAKRKQVLEYLNGSLPADHPEQEAYRLLLVSVCNQLAESMPFLFERIEDYSELLMPVDLLSSSSILHAVREAMTSQNCEDVEVIGWLYQFYISEKKDEVMARKSAVPAEDIPAVTQLFTPHWIVRYMVENSLGRLWMLNHPESRLVDKMEYYIQPLAQSPIPEGEGTSEREKLPAELLQHCRDLRQNATDAEQLLWSCLRDRQIGGYKFRRQHPVEPYILDFYCHEAKLCIELDGSGHLEDEQKHHDEKRTNFLNEQGIRVMRFWNHQVLKETEAVLEEIFVSLTPTLSQREREKREGVGENENDQPAFLRINSPEEIRLCDPACGSGHILTYAFDLLFHIYEEMGYNPNQIPALILQHNLSGIEIDRRAGSLAAFALYMKAFEKDRRFARRDVLPNICVMENISFTAEEVHRYMDKLGKDLFTQEVWQAFKQFEDAATFGSLIRPAIKNPQALLEKVQQSPMEDDLFLQETNRKVCKVLEMCSYLSARYQVVVANPPYFSTGMDAAYKEFAKEYYPDSKSDTFAMFIERNIALTPAMGFVGMVTMQSWMFLSSYESLREQLLSTKTILGMAHLGARAFDTIGGEVVSTTMFIIKNQHLSTMKGEYLRLVDGSSEEEKIDTLKEAIANPDCGWFYRASAVDFKKIPGSPIAYWVSDRVREIYSKGKTLSNLSSIGKGLSTGDNNRFLRIWWELNLLDIHFDSNHSTNSIKKWYPCNKGGSFRRWYGNQEYCINWYNDGQELYNFQPSSVIRNAQYYFKHNISWSKITSSNLSFRYFQDGFIPIDAVSCIFTSYYDFNQLLPLLNSKISKKLIGDISPTLNFEIEHIARFPVVISHLDETTSIKDILNLSKTDWNSFETSWDFQYYLLLLAGEQLSIVNEVIHSYIILDKDDCYSISIQQQPLSIGYQNLRNHWQYMTEEMQRLEEENNRTFIKAYGLQDELTPDVPLNEITLTCNPHYRYPDTRSKQYTDEEREMRLLQDTMKEFLSYAVGCMFGRYSLDKPGLLLANQGETLQDYLQQVPEPTFTPDEDNILPMLEGDWFPDDISNRFRTFLRVTFGDEHYEENLAFIEQALGRDIRSYFVRDFYKDHVQTYKKRPIYWLFSSKKGSFNALIYMHRYRPDTISILLNKYLREFQSKLRSRQAYLESVESDSAAGKSEQVNARKELRDINSTLLELKEYEDQVIYPLATEQIHIDLDDGVKVNYARFGEALKKI